MWEKCGKVYWDEVKIDLGRGVESAGEMWDTVWGERGEVCWGAGTLKDMWRRVVEVRGRCGRVHMVSVEGVGKCVEVWDW